ncbi:MAG: transcriptional repressor [Verrucomicrobiae bacterium]|nr:transcriptional repressor [Verrucomicrobiae bacterium]MDW8343054.1 transcriptional repressor [Verrucomicrobiae bacterium]
MSRLTKEERKDRWAQFEQAHRVRKLPITRQRRAVFAAVLERTDHPSADDIYDSVRRELPGISRMTVYRILANFVSLGLLCKTCHPGSVARFDPKIHHHDHLVCVECGAITDIETERPARVPLPEVRRLGFEIEDYQIHFRGRCAACRQAAPKQAHRQRRKPIQPQRRIRS